MLLQHPEHGVFRCTTERHMAVPLPVLWIKCDKRQQIYRSLKDVQPVTGTGMMEAASRIAALHIDAKGLAGAVDAALVGVTSHTVRVLTNEHGVVVLSVSEFFAALIERPSPDERTDNIPAQETVLE